VASNERPETAAMSPVIDNNSFNWSTSSATVNNKGDALSISSS